ncbi:uncharacterized protein [Misgurnus anguillicaudatus]|uniref:uncharacterized protein n=1 Tax=Misgurnus anguillicaudatus TaxID=75329 RepID=UPI003CCF39D1
MTQRESLEFAMEQETMVQVLMVHCQAMKRQETRLRLATALMLVTFLATLVWIQFHQQTTHPVSGASLKALRTDEASSRRLSVYFRPAESMTNDCLQHQTETLVQWVRLSEGLDHQHINLTNNSVLKVLTEGLYMINLRISYRVLHNQCKSSDKPEAKLFVNITQQHSNYDAEILVRSAAESMPCKQYWMQSVALNKVIKLEANTDLRVKINSESCKFVNWSKNTHLDVTLL